MDSEIYEAGNNAWLRASGYYDLPRDENGVFTLRFKAEKVDSNIRALTTNIEDLEEKLKRYRAERSEAKKYTKTDEYKASKKKSKSKKDKKAKDTVLSMLFNNVNDSSFFAEDEDDDEENYTDAKKKGGKRLPKKDTTLESRYGKRYAVVVSMLQDSAADFDRIAAEIEEELNGPKGQVRNMYRSTQIGNLLSAKNSRLSAVKEIGRIADKVTDIEYKRDKDKKADDEANTTKTVATIGRKFLTGELFNEIGSGKKGKKKDKKKKKDKSRSSFEESSEVDCDDDDGEVERVSRRAYDSGGVASRGEVAEALANELLNRKGSVRFSTYERHLGLENKYTIAVVCDVTDTKNWSYVALDPKTGKPLKGDLKDEVKALLPKRKNAKMVIDMTKLKAKDLNTGKSYKLLLRE